MTKQHYSLNEIAKHLGVKAHRVSYAISNGYLAEPAERITNRRMFTQDDLDAAKKYFDNKSNKGRPATKENYE